MNDPEGIRAYRDLIHTMLRNWDRFTAVFGIDGEPTTKQQLDDEAHGGVKRMIGFGLTVETEDEEFCIWLKIKFGGTILQSA